jgi:hypothetical protein
LAFFQSGPADGPRDARIAGLVVDGQSESSKNDWTRHRSVHTQVEVLAEEVVVGVVVTLAVVVRPRIHEARRVGRIAGRIA